MTLYEAVKQSQKPFIIITDNETKRALLNRLSKEKVFKSMQFLTQKDLYEKVFFTYNDQTIYKASGMLSLKPSIVETIMKHLYMIDVQNAYESDWLNQLRNLKKTLINQKLITYYPHLKTLLRGKAVLTTLEDNALNAMALKQVKTYTDVTYIKPTYMTSSIFSDRFETIEEEVVQLALRLRQSKDLSEQCIVYNHEDYLPVIKRVMAQFEIPVSFIQGDKMLSYPPIQGFLETLDVSDLEGSLHQALDVFKNTSSSLMRRLYTKLLQIVNNLVPYASDPEAFIALLKHRLENTRISPQTLEGAILIGTLNDIKHRFFQTVHILGCCEGVFPPILKPYDTLNNEERSALGLDDIQTLNKKQKSFWLERLTTIPEVYLSYAKRGMTEQFYRANFLDDINAIVAFKPFPIFKVETQRYSERFDLLYAKELLDYHQKTNIKPSALSDYYTWFKDALKPHSPSFKGLNPSTLEDVLPKKLSFSYTKLTTFYKCQFRYLLEHVLKVDEPFETLAIDIGQFFHTVLEKHYGCDELTDGLLEETLVQTVDEAKRGYTEREMFFLRNSYETLKRVFKEIKAQEAKSEYRVLGREVTIQKQYDIEGKSIRFSGIIDKLLVRYEEDTANVLLFDYKTGNPTLKLHHSFYGFDSQLVFYMVLLKTYFENESYKINGFYEQLVFPKPPKSEDGKTKIEQIQESLKWVGYTVDDVKEGHRIDPDLKNESMIKGMRLKNDGNFYSNVKVFSKDLLEPLNQHIEQKITEAIQGVLRGDFKINPKRNQKNQELSCTYCQFNDICYKRYEDYETLDIPENIDALLDRLQGGEKS